MSVQLSQLISPTHTYGSNGKFSSCWKLVTSLGDIDSSLTAESPSSHTPLCGKSYQQSITSFRRQLSNKLNTVSGHKLYLVYRKQPSFNETTIVLEVPLQRLVEFNSIEKFI